MELNCYAVGRIQRQCLEDSNLCAFGKREVQFPAIGRRDAPHTATALVNSNLDIVHQHFCIILQHDTRSRHQRCPEPELNPRCLKHAVVELHIRLIIASIRAPKPSTVAATHEHQQPSTSYTTLHARLPVLLLSNASTFFSSVLILASSLGLGTWPCLISVSWLLHPPDLVVELRDSGLRCLFLLFLFRDFLVLALTISCSMVFLSRLPRTCKRKRRPGGLQRRT